jgi:hypothetical protein
MAPVSQSQKVLAGPSPFAPGFKVPGGPPLAGSDQPVPTTSATKPPVSLEDLIRTQIVALATEPTRFVKQQALGVLGATTRYSALWENDTGGLVKVFLWADFSSANGDLRISRASDDTLRVAELNSSGLIVSKGIIVPNKGKLFVRNYNPNTTVNPNLAPTYTFTASDKLNVALFSLQDIGLGVG